MESGIIGTIEGDLGQIPSFNDQDQERGYGLNTCVDVRPGQTNLQGDVVLQGGEAVTESVAEVSVPSVDDDGTITTNADYQKTFVYTEFLAVPGEFIIIDGTDGEFLFDELTARTDGFVSRATVDLDSYAESRPNADPWECGFSGASGNIDAGTVYGEDVTDDLNMGDVLESSDKNQLGLEFEYEGRDIKMEVSESGFVRILEPSMQQGTFVEFVKDEIQPHW